MRRGIFIILLCSMWLASASGDGRQIQSDAKKKNKKPKIPTVSICGAMPPAGFITVSVDGICGRRGSTQLIGRSIADIRNMPTGATIDTCGDPAPAGWTSQKVYDAPCAQIGNTFYLQRTIFKIDGMAPGTSVKTCGAAIPAGWSSTKVESAPCARFLNSYFIARTLTKHEGLPARSQMKVCGNPSIPAGWVTAKVAPGYCGTFQGVDYIGRTILNTIGLQPGESVRVCGDGPPAGWVTELIEPRPCGSHGSTSYIERRIRLIAGLPLHTNVRICGGAPPRHWITTAVHPRYCAAIGNSYFEERTIRNIENAPVGTVVTICGDLTPTGWTTKSTHGYCASFGTIAYKSRTIVKTSATALKSESVVSNPDAWMWQDRIGDDPGATEIPADFDGDGRLDLAVVREEPDGLTFSIWSGTGELLRVERFGDVGDVPLAADWTGDGRAQITVFRRATPERPHSAFLYRLADTGETRSVEFASDTYDDVPILGDYDADRKADAAVHRASTGTWVVHRSSDGEEQTTTFGWSDGIPVVADYDRDGITDFALFRAGEWWILASAEGLHSEEIHEKRFDLPDDIPDIR
jgi:hypothetical protein